jgi:hypothetical protein
MDLIWGFPVSNKTHKKNHPRRGCMESVGGLLDELFKNRRRACQPFVICVVYYMAVIVSSIRIIFLPVKRTCAFAQFGTLPNRPDNCPSAVVWSSWSKSIVYCFFILWSSNMWRLQLEIENARLLLNNIRVNLATLCGWPLLVLHRQYS